MSLIRKASETGPLASHTVNAYSESESNAYSCDYSNKAFGGKILWTNPNPTSAFAGQVVQVDLSDCDMYETLFRTSIEDTHCQSSGKIPKTFTTILNYSIGNASNGPYNMYRSISAISNTSITFTDSQVAYASTRTVGGDNCIPLYIIGYKTGLFPTQQSTRSLNTYSGDIETNDDIVIDDSQEETPIDEGNKK